MGTKREVEIPRRERETGAERGEESHKDRNTGRPRESYSQARSTEDARMHRVKSRGQMAHIGHSSAREAKAEG